MAERTVFHSHLRTGDDEAWSHDHPGGGVKHDHDDMKAEALKREAEARGGPQKSADSPDEAGTNPIAGNAPAGYDEHGQVIASQKDRLAANTEEKSKALDETVQSKDKEAPKPVPRRKAEGGE